MLDRTLLYVKQSEETARAKRGQLANLDKEIERKMARLEMLEGKAVS